MSIAEMAESREDPSRHKRLSLHTKILIGLAVGAVLGVSANLAFRVPAGSPSAATLDANQNGISDQLEWWAQGVADPIGRVFLRLVLMVVVPLVCSALILGVLGLGDLSRLGRVGLRSLWFTVLLSGSSVAIGLALVNTIQPGARLSAQQREALQQAYAQDAQEKVEHAKKAKPIQQILLDLLPENPLQEMVGAVDGSSKGNGMLAVMCFALIFGIAMTIVSESRRAVLVALLEGL
jgi:DAACS family dicarboxylate/amino acid:cation (Na+ or H+) symporter